MIYLELIGTILVAFITAVMGPIALAWAKSKFEKKSDKTPMVEAIENSSQIDSQLDSLMEDIEEYI